MRLVIHFDLPSLSNQLLLDFAVKLQKFRNEFQLGSSKLEPTRTEINSHFRLNLDDVNEACAPGEVLSWRTQFT